MSFRIAKSYNGITFNFAGCLQLRKNDLIYICKKVKTTANNHPQNQLQKVVDSVKYLQNNQRTESR